MSLEKIESGTAITLKVKRDSTVADFDTVLIEHVGNCLVCEPLLHENKIINFSIPGVTHEVQIFDKSIGKLYAWRNIEVKAGYYKKKTLCHLIYLNSIPVEINRRTNYRQFVGVEGTVFPFHKQALHILIRDVSNNGVGFIASEKGELEVGADVRVVFKDCDNRFNFALNCRIVRERELSRDTFEFGCKVIDPPSKLAQYVAHKQLLERKRVLGLR